MPLIRIIFFCTDTHKALCRVAYGVAPVDSQKGKSGGRKGKGGEGGGGNDKKYVGNREREKIEKLRVWRKTEWISIGADILPPEQRESPETRKANVDGRMVMLKTTYHIRQY